MTTPNELILGIDLGTSGPKAAIADRNGEILAWDFAPIGVTLLPGGGAEQSPNEWWRAITTAARGALAKCGAPASAVKAVCSTTQWSGTVAVNEAGEPLMNAVIWMDSRGAPYLNAAVGGPLSIEGYSLFKVQRLIRLTGGAPGHAGKDPTAHILFIKNVLPEIYAKTHKFLEPKDWVNLKMTGEIAGTFDSLGLHWVTDNRDLKKVDYDDKLLAIFGIDRAKLPALTRAVAVVGSLTETAAADLSLEPGTPVFGGTPDLHSAAIGSGGVLDYESHLYIGSSSWLVCHVPFKKTDMFRNVASLPSANPERYLVVNTQETAGGCLNFLINNILFADDELSIGAKPDDAHLRINRVAEKAPPGSEKLMFLPWLYGERTPVENSTLRGGFFNLSLKHTRSHLCRAVLEGVGYNSNWLLATVEHFIKRRIDPLRFVGGGAQSDLWCQIHADVLDREIQQMQDPILANVRGAIFVAAVGMGYMKFEDIPERVPVAKTYQPNPENRAIYDEMYAAFLGIHGKTKSLYASLNKQAAVERLEEQS